MKLFSRAVAVLLGASLSFGVGSAALAATSDDFNAPQAQDAVAAESAGTTATDTATASQQTSTITEDSSTEQTQGASEAGGMSVSKSSGQTATVTANDAAGSQQATDESSGADADSGEQTEGTSVTVSSEMPVPVETDSQTAVQALALTSVSQPFGATVLKVINAERAKAGLSALTLNAAAQRFAQSFTEEWVSQFATCGKTTLAGCHMDEIKGSSYRGQQAVAQGWSRGADLLARGYSTEEAVAQAWLNSAGHRAWLMNGNGDISAIGLGRVTKTVTSGGRTYTTSYWTLWAVGGAKTNPKPDLTVVTGTQDAADTDASESTEEPAASTAAPEATSSVERLGGDTRYATNLAVNQQTIQANKPVFVATGANFPDALAVGSAVAKTGGTLFLTNADSADAAALALVRRYGASKVYVIGGTTAVSDAVAKAYAAAGGTSYTRIAGNDRYETALKVFNTFFKSASTVFIATGADFPDALSAASAAGTLNAPVMLVPGTASSLTSAQSAALKSAGTTTIQIVGGGSAVSTALQSRLSQSYTVGRLAGNDRYETNTKVNTYVQNATGTKASSMWVATGVNFPDALSAAAPAGDSSSRLVLSNGRCLPTAGQQITKSVEGLSVRLVGGSSVLLPALTNLKSC